MIYFTADLHLGHENVVRLCDRPFASGEEMDAVLIENWNRRVGKKDTVYILGDLIWDKKKALQYLQQLSGKKILITGNHDKDWLKAEGAKDHFLEIHPYLEKSLDGHPITMCHYPMLEWHNSREIGSRKWGYLIHGHIHNRYGELYRTLFAQENALNAGVDVNGYMPVTFAELVENNRAYKRRKLEEAGEAGGNDVSE